MYIEQLMVQMHVNLAVFTVIYCILWSSAVEEQDTLFGIHYRQLSISYA
jgi:hypothetical protein